MLKIAIYSLILNASNCLHQSHSTVQYCHLIGRNDYEVRKIESEINWLSIFIRVPMLILLMFE